MLVFVAFAQRPAERVRESTYKVLVRLLGAAMPRHHPAVDAAAFQAWKRGVTRLWQAWGLTNFQYLIGPHSIQAFLSRV